MPSTSSSSVSSTSHSESCASGERCYTPIMAPTASRRPKRPKSSPQDIIDDFWAKFNTKVPGKATTVIPQNNYADIVAKKKRPAAINTEASYDEAAAMCRAKVEKIVNECRRINKKYRDPHFDIEADLKLGVRDCLKSLSNAPIDDNGDDDDNSDDDDNGTAKSGPNPRSVKRVVDIFDKPQLYIDGPTANDVRQGRDGDCWFLAALCTLSNKKGLIEKLCVAHDQDVGVYGFVFHRDGEWISEIVDDFLYLIKPDYDEGILDRVLFDDVGHINAEEAYRKVFQSNSNSLYFAQCEHPQETWLPLLEKCYAKAHGDYAAIEGGFGGEGIEDLTGGVTSELYTADILDKEHFWREELLKVNQDFLFGCSTGVWGSVWGERKGIVELHAYSVQKAVELDGHRLLKLKNPWGKGEWNGPWSDGSKEWTPEMMQKLNHRFGDDGDFWISYDDLLRKYQAFDRTRLFGPEWRVTQIWSTLAVPWTLDYLDTHFHFSLSKPGPVVVVLAQLDDRYFRGLEGQYSFELAFRVHKAGHEDYIVRSQRPYRIRRSINVELDLEAGEYEVRVKIDATRRQEMQPIERVIRNNAKQRRDKLTRIGLAYDLAHSKGRVVESKEEKAIRKEHEKKTAAKTSAEMKKKILAEREQYYYLQKKQHERDEKRKLKARQKAKTKAAEKKARKAEKAAKKAAEKNEQEKTFEDTDAKTFAATKGERRVTEGTVATEEEKAEVISPTTPKSSDNDEDPSEKIEGSPVIVTKPEKKAAETASTEEANMSGAEIKGPSSEESQPEADETPEQVKDKKFAAHDIESDDGSDNDDDLLSMDSMSDRSERELDIEVKQRLSSALVLPVIPLPAVANELDEPDEPDEFELDPWNAVVVVGLRVYYKAPAKDQEDETVQLKVVRLDPFASEDGNNGEEAKEKSKGLDVDDSAKDATLEGGVKDRKKSIMGDASRRSRPVC